LALRHLR